jgi:NADH:ubiquinone oxidoreductase subunit
MKTPINGDMKTFLLQFFTWWHGQTLGTRFYTWRHGEPVGDDEEGNLYYRTKGGRIDPALGFERRWVIFKNTVEASKVPAGWRAWLHHTVAVPPSQETYTPRPWQIAHSENKTGTALAYRPATSLLAARARPLAPDTYVAWNPDASIPSPTRSEARSEG